jgi:IS605 OrfB family transposase
MSSDVPVGLYRTYARISDDQPFNYDAWCAAVRAGRTFLSGGPLLHFTVNGAEIGDTLRLPGNGGTIEVEATAESIFPIHRKCARGPPAFRRRGNSASSEGRPGCSPGSPPFLQNRTHLWYISGVQRTVRLKLKPTPEQATALLETIAQFTAAFNHVAAEGWRLRDGNAYTLHRLTYRHCKSAHSALVSDLHVQARQKAAEAVRSALTLKRKGKKVNGPHAMLCPPRFNRHSYRLDWDSRSVRLSTTRGRIRVPFSLPPYALYALGMATATADLVCKKGRFYLHVVITLPDVLPQETGAALGVDLGVTRPAVTSKGQFLGKKQWREVVKRRLRLRRALQANGSKSAKRRLRRLAGREKRFRRDCDHVLSKRIVEGIEPGTVIVVENLTNIRRRVKARRGEAKRRLHSWSFAQLRGFLEYKAEAKGCGVVGVDPRHTSQRCNACGHIARSNRPRPSAFCCRECSHRANADLNAARNIRDRHLVGWASGPSNGPPSTGLSSRISLPSNGDCFGPGTS